METQQMTEFLLKMEANRNKYQDDLMKKLDADRKTDKEEIKTNQAKLLARLEDDRQDERRFLKEMMQIMDTSHKEIMAESKPGRDMETMACQEMEECQEEEEEEVPVEDAIVKPVKGRRKRYRGKKQAAERCEESEELTRGICGSRRKLAAACRKVSRRAAVARSRRDAFKNERTQDGCQRRLAAARRGTSHRAEVVRKMIFRQADKKMSRRATVARRMRDIFRQNTTRRATVAGNTSAGRT
jgi:flagellar biosynthesis chaperone FliJ